MAQTTTKRRGTLRQRVIVLGGFLTILAAFAFIAISSLDGTGNGSGSSTPPTGLKGDRLPVREVGRLSQPLQGAASTSQGGELLLAGGIDQGGSPLSSVVRVSSSGSEQSAGHLPSRSSGISLVELGESAYVFDGRLILQLQGGGTTRRASLARSIANAGAATLAGTAFLVGGYSFGHPLASVIAWQPPGNPYVTAHLPAAVRYPAVASVGNRLIIAGGTVGGAASNQILRFDPATHRVRRIGTLPAALTHAAAATIGRTVYVVGGRGGALNSQTRAIYAINPSSGKSHFAGSLPERLSDVALAQVGSRLLLAGGIDRGGRVHDGVLAIG